MIIFDADQHKIDATWQQDGYLRVTVFKKTGDEWRFKEFGLSPEVQDKLAAMIAHRDDRGNQV